MPAFIRVQSPENGTVDYLIETQAIRIGSSSACEVRMNGLPAHLMTVHFRNGKWIAINRHTEGINIGGTSCRPCESFEWNSRRTVRFGTATLGMLFQGSRAPYSRTNIQQRSRAEEPGVEVEKDSTPSPKKEYGQYAILAFCLVVIGFLLLPTEPRAREMSANAASQQILASLNEFRGSADPRVVQLMQHIQHGTLAEIRGHLHEADREYRLIGLIIEDWDSGRDREQPYANLPQQLRRHISNFSVYRIGIIAES